MPLSRPVALFDMDRTLIDVHTGTLYLRFQRELGEVSALDLLRKRFWLFQYGIGWVNAEGIARMLGAEYRDKPERWMRERCRGWFDEHVRVWVSSVGRERVREHQRAGHAVAIVTSTLRQMAQPLADELGIAHMVCSDLEVRDEAFTGTFELPLCYGAGKVGRVRALVESFGSTLEQATYYSDSITDLPLLEAVKKPICVNPDWRLRMVARRRGWPTENWTNAFNTARLSGSSELASESIPRQP